MNKISSFQRGIAFLFLMLISFFQTHLALADDATFYRIKSSGVMKVGMSGEQPPFNFATNKTGVIGYDVELADQIAKSMDVKVEIQLMPFGELMGALQSNKIDVIISGFSYSKERNQIATLIGPYALAGKSLLVTKNNLQRIRSSTGFDHSDVRIMALKNSTSYTLAEKRLPKAKLTAINHYEDALLALRADETDALLTDIVICDLAIIRDTTSKLTRLQTPLAIEEIVIATNKKEAQLESLLRASILTLTENGEMEKLQQKWFKNPGWLDLLP